MAWTSVSSAPVNTWIVLSNGKTEAVGRYVQTRNTKSGGGTQDGGETRIQWKQGDTHSIKDPYMWKPEE